ncbi:MAG: bifunctional hydroxymethylpyrimidine kinase/phosphomethylpyrimidine kinase [Bacteroidales bacterium]|nr:bifunctional hydroxymethylpyrimidine kinase/phosphomethylpyrimidine kinase [Bacteroidales bacterium]MCR5714969.1 bifunctional hydroxymethylpyrimidine kinase/phosphomethylpyrimidine kinase [Bacteroidales bacterium]
MKRHYPRVLSIAGSDSGGCAGIQADLKTIAALGGFGMTAITAVTVQNTMGVKAVHAVPPDIIRGQIAAVAEDIGLDAVKSGMLADTDTVCLVAECLRKYHPPFYVLDPVMVATSGDALVREETAAALKRELMPLATVVTPNLKEAELLSGRRIETIEDMQAAASELLACGCKAVLVKGGHLDGGDMTDVLCIAGEDRPHYLSTPRIPTGNLHGTGCTLSSAIAVCLALGHPLAEAVGRAKDYISEAIAAGADVTTGHGHGPVCHSSSPVRMQILTEPDMP